jgi:hypothetical protein
VAAAVLATRDAATAGQEVEGELAVA